MQPTPDPKTVEESLQAHERGDYITTEELLGEIALRADRKEKLEDLHPS